MEAENNFQVILDKIDLLLNEAQKITNEAQKINDRLDAQEMRLDHQDLQLRPLAEVIMEAQELTKLKGFSHSAITNSPNTEKFVIPTKKKVLVSVKSVAVMQKPKKR